MNICITTPHEMIREGLLRLIGCRYPLAHISFSPAVHLTSTEACAIEASILFVDRSSFCFYKEVIPEGAAIIVLMSDANISDVDALLRQGVQGVLFHFSTNEEVAAAIGVCQRGGTYIPQYIGGKLEEHRRLQVETGLYHKKLNLTARQRDVLILLKQRMTAKEIAESLYISLSTVKTHLQNIYQEFGVQNRTECLKLAHLAGYI